MGFADVRAELVPTLVNLHGFAPRWRHNWPIYRFRPLWGPSWRHNWSNMCVSPMSGRSQVRRLLTPWASSTSRGRDRERAQSERPQRLPRPIAKLLGAELRIHVGSSHLGASPAQLPPAPLGAARVARPCGGRGRRATWRPCGERGENPYPPRPASEMQVRSARGLNVARLLSRPRFAKKFRRLCS